MGECLSSARLSGSFVLWPILLSSVTSIFYKMMREWDLSYCAASFWEFFVVSTRTDLPANFIAGWIGMNSDVRGP